MNNLTALDLLAANAGPAPDWFKPKLSQANLEEIRTRLEIIGSDRIACNFGWGIQEDVENRERQLQWPYYYANEVLARKPIVLPADMVK
jgi:hypothetical protein